MTLLDETLAAIRALPDAERRELKAVIAQATARDKWTPHPDNRPQVEAYHSKADVLLYGGEPGGGKSQLILGLAFNCHQRSLIMRRQYGDLERLIDDALKIHGSRDGFNGSPPPRLRLANDCVIHFRAAQHIGDEQGTMGQGRDFLGIDEATHFAESQIRFLMGWVRTETPGQRCRTVLATNPALTAEGEWVHSMFAPWLDDAYPDPAEPGELRWVLTNEEGKDEWVSGPDDVRFVRDKEIRPKSRTYIPASVRDNPYYRDTDYQRELDNLPEPHRSILLGGFKARRADQEWQLIPTAWIEAAQARWKPDGWRDFAMTALAIDPAGGGRDSQEIAYRHNCWYGPLVSTQGAHTADPSYGLAMMLMHRKDGCPVVVDNGGGYGEKFLAYFTENKTPHIRFNGAGESTAKTRDGKLGFVNKRAEAWWRFREELDPEQQGGSVIALPPDKVLKADLAAPTFEVRRNGILVESKEDIKKRLGRSPGKGDAVVMCMSEGNAAVRRNLRGSGTGWQPPKVTRGYENLKRRRA